MSESYFDWTAKLFDLTKTFSKPEALKGIRVLDLASSSSARRPPTTWGSWAQR